MTGLRIEAHHTTDRPDPGSGRRLAAGFVTQGGSFVLLLPFLLVPVFPSMWNKPVYGGWLVLYACCGLLFLADLGMHGRATAALRLSWARGDAAGFLRLPHGGLGACAALTAAWTVVLLAFVAVVDVPALLDATHVEPVTQVLMPGWLRGQHACAAPVTDRGRRG